MHENKTSVRKGPTTYGIIAEFDNPADLIAATEIVRDQGFKRWDVHTPYPVHGLDGAMGIRPTILPLIVFGGGLTGFFVGLALQWWTNAVDYPFLISGKPYFSLPANIPIIFEVTVLFSAITTVLAMLVLNNLPLHYHPLFTCDRFRRSTSDRFFIAVEAQDPKFDAKKTHEFMSSLPKVLHVETITEDEGDA